MTKTEPHMVDRDLVERLVLARMLVRTKEPLSSTKLVEAVTGAISAMVPAQRAEAAAREALAACVARGYVELKTRKPKSAAQAQGKHKPRSTKPARRIAEKPVLTTKGRREAPRMFDRASMPVIKSWRQAQQLVGLSRLGRSEFGERELQVQPLAAAILATTLDVPAAIATLPAVVDYLSWRALGIESRAEFSVDAVQRYLLRDIVPADVRVDRKIWRRMLAMKVIGANGHDAQALTRALLSTSKQRSAKRKPSAKTSRPPNRSRSAPTKPRRVANDNESSSHNQPTLVDFAVAVREAACRPSVARFHDDRAFIGSVWEHMRGHAPVGNMSLSEFKERLIEAHQTRLLRITRADLVSAMDPAEVERSEASYQGATFHFVALEVGGVR